MKHKKLIIVLAVVVVVIAACAVTVYATKDDGIGAKLFALFNNDSASKEVVATADGIEIYKNELDSLELMNPGKTREEVLTDYAGQKLLYRFIYSTGITVSDAELEENIKQNKTVFETVLAKSPDDCKVITDYCDRAGITWQEYFDLPLIRETYRNGIAYGKFFEAEFAKSDKEMTDEEKQTYRNDYVQQFYDSVKDKIIIK